MRTHLVELFDCFKGEVRGSPREHTDDEDEEDERKDEEDKLKSKVLDILRGGGPVQSGEATGKDERGEVFAYISPSPPSRRS